MAANSHQFQNKRLISITDLQDCFTSRTAFDEWKRLVSHVDARRCLYPPIYLATDAPAISNDERELQLSSLQTVYCIEISTDSTLPSWSVAEPLSNRVSDARTPSSDRENSHLCSQGCGLRPPGPLGASDSTFSPTPLLGRRTVLTIGALTKGNTSRWCQ